MHRDLVVSDAFLRPNPRLFHAKLTPTIMARIGATPYNET
jgi:hypothetical protein